MNAIQSICGNYVGSGSWHDSAGTSMAYRIVQSVVVTEAGFEVWFKHDFDDASVVEARFNMKWITPSLFRVDVANTSIGNGYIFDGYCHYHMKAGEAFVEASYRPTTDGLEVFGSSSRNTDGNYIAWKEVLHRTA